MPISKRQLDANGNPSVLSFEQNQAMIIVYRHGFSATEAAAFFNLSMSAVYYKFRQFKAAGVKIDLKPTITDALELHGYSI